MLVIRNKTKQNRERHLEDSGAGSRTTEQKYNLGGWPDMSRGRKAFTCDVLIELVSLKYLCVSTTYNGSGEGHAPEESEDKYRKFCYICH